MKNKPTLVVVADAGHLKLFSTDDRGASIATVTGMLDAPPNPPSREHKSDKPGRGQETIAGRRTAYEPKTDPHNRAEAEFAKSLVSHLEKLTAGNAYKDILLFAPPVFLGELRKDMSDALRAKISAEVHKDLTKAPTEDVRQHVRAALFPE